VTELHTRHSLYFVSSANYRVLLFYKAQRSSKETSGRATLQFMVKEGERKEEEKLSITLSPRLSAREEGASPPLRRPSFLGRIV
jgi:hypothetical protein